MVAGTAALFSSLAQVVTLVFSWFTLIIFLPAEEDRLYILQVQVLAWYLLHILFVFHLTFIFGEDFALPLKFDSSCCTVYDRVFKSHLIKMFDMMNMFDIRICLILEIFKKTRKFMRISQEKVNLMCPRAHNLITVSA